MKTVVKEAIRDEKGQVLILALILLVVGGLILTPLLGLMSTGLLAGKVYEKKMDEYYAADAGVEDAIWRIQTNNLTFAANNSSEPWHLTVNDRSVDVVVYRKDLDPTPCGKDFTYQIISTAATDGGGGTAAIGSGTQIEAYIVGVGANFSGLLDNVITSLNGYTVKGNVTYPEGNGPYGNYPPDLWPSAQTLRDFYWVQVNDKTAYSSPLDIDLAGTDMTLEAGYVNGAMTITNSDQNTTPTLKLNGTLYVKGSASIYGPTGNTPFHLTLDLNSNTIFVDDNTVGGGNALDIAKCNIRGPGVIIAVGDIYFAPKAQTGADAPIFIMSILGSTKSNPNGDFYGAIAGNVTVTMQPNTSLTYPIGGFGSYNLNFPTGTPDQIDYSIASWEISGV